MQAIGYRPLLFREVLGSEYRKAMVVVLRAYFDASGKPDQVFLTVGGFVTTVELWDETFVPRWKAILEEYGLPYFRMSDFEHCKGVFEGWTRDDPRRHELFQKLSEPMIACRPLAIAVSLDMLAWHVHDLRIHAELGVRHPYHLCAHLCLEMAGKLRNEHAPGVQLAAWFDNDDEGAGDLITGFEEMKRHGVVLAEPDSISFPKKKTPASEKPVPLQAADVIAFEFLRIGRLLVALDGPPTKWPPRGSIALLVGQMPMYHYLINISEMPSLLAQKARGARPTILPLKPEGVFW